jgi:hypothetical protein
LPTEWYVTSKESEDNALLPPDVPPTSSYRLRGPDFELYWVISNDIRGMASLYVDIPPEVLGETQLIDLQDFLERRAWAPMDLARHLEMFPGQARIVLAARPEVCARWRDVLAERLIDVDQRQLTFNLNLARNNGLNVGEIESMITRAVDGEPLGHLALMDQARNRLQDLIYETPHIRDARSKIIEANAIVCACDGALCRALMKGKAPNVEALGQKVIPLAREFTNLRLELRRGKGAQILPHCEGLANRARALLSEIREA